MKMFGGFGLRLLQGWLLIGLAWLLIGVNARPLPAQVLDGAQGMQAGEFQMRTDAKKIFETERSFFRRACRLSAEQEAELAKLDEKSAVEEVAAELRKAQVRPKAGGIFLRLGGAPAQAVVNGDQAGQIALAKFRQVALDGFGKLLTPEQLASYKSELSARDEFRRRAEAECLVMLLDERLDFTSDQRERLKTKLSSWPEVADLYLPFYFQNTGYVPNVPVALMAGILSAEQLKIFNGLQKASVSRKQFMGNDPFGL